VKESSPEWFRRSSVLISYSTGRAIDELLARIVSRHGACWKSARGGI